MNDAMLGTLLGILITVLQCFAGVLFFDIFLKRRLTGLRFWGMFAVLTIIIKYLSLLVDLTFKQQKYLIESIEKIQK